VHRYEEALKLVGEDPGWAIPLPAIRPAACDDTEEKSLACIHKGGHRPVEEVYDYGKQWKSGKGLVIMDTAGAMIPSSVAGMVAGGAQIVVFSTGRGTPTGNPVAPVIKIRPIPLLTER
jgi:altronate dehydratase large subunit